MKIGCVLLASGLSERFGSNKLLTSFFGKTLIENTMDALPPASFSKAVAVTAYKEVAEAAYGRGYYVVMNDSPSAGVRHTIRLGLEQMADMDACLFCVCDQPYISGASVAAMLADYRGGIAALSSGGRRGNPVLFPAELFSELQSLAEGESGSAVIARHEDMLRLYPVLSALELEDVDCAEDAERLAGVKNLFVTGCRDAGKSTLLEYALGCVDSAPSGFITREYHINGRVAGHYIHALSPWVMDGDNDKPISVKTGEGSCIPVAEVFGRFGAGYLERARSDGAALIFMDELGTLEREEELFKAEVFRCLDGKKPVLGTLKAAGDCWLTDIMERKDTLVLELTEENRDAVLERVLAFIKLINA